MTNIYGSGVYAYLARARRQLDAGEHDALFYAALELRCGIESRIRQYLEARHEMSKHKKKNAWKLTESERELAKVFRVGRTVVELILTTPAIAGEVRLFHTPIGPELAKAGSQLDDLRHSAKTDRDYVDPWWLTTRKRLEDTFTALELASCGTLLAPPTIPRDGRTFHMNAFYHNSNPMRITIESFARLPRGTRTNMSVRYHETIPSYAEPFLNRWEADVA